MTSGNLSTWVLGFDFFFECGHAKSLELRKRPRMGFTSRFEVFTLSLPSTIVIVVSGHIWVREDGPCPSCTSQSFEDRIFSSNIIFIISARIVISRA